MSAIGDVGGETAATIAMTNTTTSMSETEDRSADDGASESELRTMWTENMMRKMMGVVCNDGSNDGGSGRDESFVTVMTTRRLFVLNSNDEWLPSNPSNTGPALTRQRDIGGKTIWCPCDG